jgi:hypothetical protein
MMASRSMIPPPPPKDAIRSQKEMVVLELRQQARRCDEEDEGKQKEDMGLSMPSCDGCTLEVGGRPPGRRGSMNAGDSDAEVLSGSGAC